MPSSNEEPRSIKFSIHLYCWILRLGPGKFLQEYGEEILLDFRRYCRDTYKRRRACGVLWLLLRMSIRAAVDMGIERLSAEPHPKEEKLIKAERNAAVKLHSGSLRRIILILEEYIRLLEKYQESKDGWKVLMHTMRLFSMKTGSRN
jgi:hypothetical protein